MSYESIFAMDRPVPAPREGKRPVPTPRRHVNKISEPEVKISENTGNNITESMTEVNIIHTIEEKENVNDNKMVGEKGDQFNTFSRRVTNASKQIAGE